MYQNTFFYCAGLDLNRPREMKLAKSKFDAAQFIVCYCGSCARHFSIFNKYEAFISMTHRVARKSKYAIHDFQERQKFLGERAVSDTKEGIIRHINDNGSVMKSMCPECMIADYQMIFETMHEKNREVLDLGNNFVFEKDSLAVVKGIIEDDYQGRLFAGYLNVKDLRQVSPT